MGKIKRIFINLAKAILLIVLVVSIGYVGYAFGSKSGILMTNVVHASDSTIILKELSEISELSVYRHEYCGVAISKAKNQKMGVDIPFSESIKLIKYQGYIKVGTDFSKIQINIDDSTKAIKIKVTKSAIQENAIRTEKTTIEDIKGEIFSNYPSQLILDDINKDKKELENQIVKDGLLEKSDKRIAIMLESVAKSNGYKKVEIEFI